MSLINFPILYIPDPGKGRPLFNGQIYVGQPDLDPTVVINQKQLNVIEENGTVVPVAQPFVLSAGGVPVYNGKPVRLDVDGNYSIKILSKLGAQVYYIENVFEGQPVTEALLINDLSQAYDFTTVAAYKASAIAFPAGKRIYLADRKADFVVISGTGTANNYNVIASTGLSQSISWVHKQPLNLGEWGAVGGIDIAPIIRAAQDLLTKGGQILIPQNVGGSYLFSSLDTNGTDCVTLDEQNLSIVGESYGIEIDCTIACDRMIGLNAGFLDTQIENLFLRGSPDAGVTVYANSGIQTFNDASETSRLEIKRVGGEYFNGDGCDVWAVDTTLEQVKFSHCSDGANGAHGISLRGQLASNLPTTSTVLTDCGSFNCDNGMLLDKTTYVTLNSCNNEKCEIAFNIQRADTVVLNACGGEEIAKMLNCGDTADSLKSVSNLIINGIFIFDVVNRKSTGTPSDRLFSFNRTKAVVNGIEMSVSQRGFVNKTPISVDTTSNIVFDNSVSRIDVICQGDGQAKFPEPDHNTSTGIEEVIYLGDGGDDDQNAVSSAGTPYATFDRVRQLLPHLMNQRYNLKIVGTYTGDLQFRNIKASLGQDTGSPVFNIEGNTGTVDIVTGIVSFGGCTGGEGGNGIEVDTLTIGGATVGTSLGVKIKAVTNTSTGVALNIKASHTVVDGMIVTGNPTQAVNCSDTSLVKVRNVSGACVAAINSQASTVYKSGTAFTVGADTTQQAGQILV